MTSSFSISSCKRQQKHGKTGRCVSGDSQAQSLAQQRARAGSTHIVRGLSLDDAVAVEDEAVGAWRAALSLRVHVHQLLQRRLALNLEEDLGAVLSRDSGAHRVRQLAPQDRWHSRPSPSGALPPPPQPHPPPQTIAHAQCPAKYRAALPSFKHPAYKASAPSLPAPGP